MIKLSRRTALKRGFWIVISALSIALLTMVIRYGSGLYRRAVQEDLDARLVTAVEGIEPAMTRDLLKRGANPNNLRRPVRRRLREILYDLIRRRTPQTKLGSPLLRTAIEHLNGPGIPVSRMRDREAMVLTLLEYGADPNDVAGALNTPLILALRAHSECVVEALLRHGADPNIPNDSGDTPLTISIFDFDGGSSKEIVGLLLDWHADVNGKPGWAHVGTPLEAAASERPSMVPFLLSRGAGVNVQDGMGDAPINYAVRAGDLAVVETLVGAGADVNSNGSDGAPISSAAASGNTAMVRLLLSYGARVDASMTGELESLGLDNRAILGILKRAGRRGVKAAPDAESQAVFREVNEAIREMRKSVKP